MPTKTGAKMRQHLCTCFLILYAKAGDYVTPVQPYFVFATYQYHKKMMMRDGIAHVYHYHQNCAEFETISAVPDGCVDIYFERSRKGVAAKVCGTVLARHELNNQKGNEYFGIRFMPGIMPSNLNVQMKELVGKEI